MTLTINIPQEIEQRLKTAATRLGLDEAEYATRLIEQSLPPVSQSVDQATLDLLASWDAGFPLRGTFRPRGDHPLVNVWLTHTINGS